MPFEPDARAMDFDGVAVDDRGNADKRLSCGVASARQRSGQDQCDAHYTVANPGVKSSHQMGRLS